MKDVARMALKPGMVIAKEVLNYKNERILAAGTKVDEAVIGKLARHSIVCVTVMEDIDYAVTYFEKIRFSDDFRVFEKIYLEVMPDFKNEMQKIIDSPKDFSMEKLMQIYYTIMSGVENKERILDYLYNMLPSEDNMTYAHCLNSALIAGVLGEWMVLSEEDKVILIQCAFLYDIGKLKLPNSLIWKPDKLTPVEFEQIKTHTFLGFQLIKDLPVNDHVLRATLMHHERYDGSGYPSKLHDVQIDIFARYISIIDSYEAMTSARVYRQSKHPFQVIEIFESSPTKYDVQILKIFLYRLANHIVGLKVLLSDDRKAEVILINQQHMSRPLLRDANNDFIDLMERKDIKILGIY